jgi:hypothetical protein
MQLISNEMQRSASITKYEDILSSPCGFANENSEAETKLKSDFAATFGKKEIRVSRSGFFAYLGTVPEITDISNIWAWCEQNLLGCTYT